MCTSIKAALALSLTAILLSAASCDKDPLSLSPEELAARIRANTPTELPPITMTGANTMGAYIHPQPGSPLWEQAGRVDSFLFVASGVDRPETALAESLDCGAFNNYLKQSSGWTSIIGTYCARPEINDPKRISVTFSLVTSDSAEVYLNYTKDEYDIGNRYWSHGLVKSSVSYNITRDDRTAQIISGTFATRVINRAAPFDTVDITDGRFDVTYGVTP